MSAEMMKTAKSIKHCMMIATDAKGKNYLIDTSIKQGTPNVKSRVPGTADAGFVRAGICGKVGREMAGCRRSFAPPVCAERRQARRQAPVPGKQPPLGPFGTGRMAYSRNIRAVARNPIPKQDAIE
ncbi:hypothetical protein [Mesorhizobium sp.]|uniref:hypothetical protein n=1 Tax=Mesorhizobium sp. TaxID=1871066 RepID=UPI0025C14FD8|nr:hypothetical protein [Mesorhizobium sp.]